MKPIKGKVYEIDFKPKDSRDAINAYKGKATCIDNNAVDSADFVDVYTFSIDGKYTDYLFAEEDIVSEVEMSGNEKV